MQNPEARLQKAQQAVHEFVLKHSLPEDVMPRMQHLQQAGELELIQDIKALGGFAKLAASMQLHFSTAQLPTLALAAEGLRDFVEENQSKMLQGQAPSFPDLWRAGRFDLSSAYRKFGQANVIQAASLKPKTGNKGYGKGKTQT